MAAANKLEHLDVWVNAKALVRRVYQITRSETIRRDYAYCNQIRSAAISIMSNIAEGFGRSSDKEFARFLDIARGSGMETQSLLHVGVDVGYLEQATFHELHMASDHIIAQITSLARHLRRDTGKRGGTILRFLGFVSGLATKVFSP